MTTTARADNIFSDEQLLLAERARLVRLCASLSGDIHVAEDLAQETLIEAWRHAERLQDPADYMQWHSGIAKNVCLRWLRRQGREMSRRIQTAGQDDSMRSDLDMGAAADVDLEVELERDELAMLLDRALALLPSETRDVLIERYVEEAPYAEIAERLKLSKGAVGVRLHRGKLALRRLLTTELRQEAETYGLVNIADDGWHETRIWCARCGRRRLVGRLCQSPGQFELQCPDCYPVADFFSQAKGPISPALSQRLFAGIRGYKPVLNRVMRWVDEHYQRALATGRMPCNHCGELLPVQWSMGEHVPPSLQQTRGIHIWCPTCQLSEALLLSHLVLYSPEGRSFWKKHPRIHELPMQKIEAEGRPALVVSFASITDAARLDIVCDRETYCIIGVHRDHVL